MQCYGGKDLARTFRTVRKNTLMIAEEIPEEHYAFSPAPATRTAGQMLAHIAVSSRLQQTMQSDKVATLENFDFMRIIGPITAQEQVARTKEGIIGFLKSEGEVFATWVGSLGDDFLAERVAMPPGGEVDSKSRFEMLMGVKEHEMHHRGQLMLIERMIGITPHLTRAMEERMAARAGS